MEGSSKIGDGPDLPDHLYQARGAVEKVFALGSAHLSPADAGAAVAVMRVTQETAYHGIRRPRYAGYRYAVPVQSHFFNTPVLDFKVLLSKYGVSICEMRE
jgi:hypothetical protein